MLFKSKKTPPRKRALFRFSMRRETSVEAPKPLKWYLIRRFARFITPHYGLMILLCACFIINQALIVVMPLAFGHVIDKVLPNHDASALDLIVLGLIAFLIIRSVAIFVERETGALVGSLVVSNVRTHLHRHLLKMSLKFLDDYQVGRIASRILGDTECVRQLLISGFVNGTASGVRLIFILVTLLIIDWRMTLVSGFTLPIFFFGFWFAADKLKPAYRELNDDNANLSANVNETFSGMRVVKTYCGERRVNLGFVTRVHQILRKGLFVSRTQHVITIVWEGVAWISVISMLWYGGHRVLNGNMTAGGLVAFYGLLGQLHGPISDLINLNATLQPAMASIEQLSDIFDHEPDIKDKADAREAKALQGAIEFCDVRFSYIKDTKIKDSKIRLNTLEKIRFHVKPGESIAIVGASGSGKSTLINLLARLYDVDEGSIKVDGVDIRDYRLTSYLSSLAVVLQENFLFKGTFRDNIRYSRWNASDEEIIAAAKMAGAWDFITEEGGLDAVCGERGVTLSGGQKQRVSIARAILANPTILILDEATSALDTRTEKQIQLALEKLMKGRTSFIVAHRLSTIVNADKIIVLDQGKIVEMGSHTELLNKEGRYAEMYHEQFGTNTKHAAPLTLAAV